MAWCTISCLVTDAEGTPIEGAVIRIQPKKLGMTVAGQVITQQVVSVTTDEYGEAEFDLPQQDSITSADKQFKLTIRNADDSENIFAADVYSPNTTTATLDELINQALESAT